MPLDLLAIRRVAPCLGIDPDRLSPPAQRRFPEIARISKSLLNAAFSLLPKGSPRNFRSFRRVSIDSRLAPPRVALSDYERDAAARLDPGALGYYGGGAGDELTLAENVAAWQRIELLPRVLRGVGRRDLSVTLLGRERPHPLIVAPMAFQRMAH